MDVKVEAVTDTSAVTLPDPLTIDAIQARRTAAGKLVAGTAAVADIELFKGRHEHAHKPPAKSWSREFPYFDCARHLTKSDKIA